MHFSNKTISANNTPAISPCSSPTIVKKDAFSKITGLAAAKIAAEISILSNPTPATPHHIHRHHRNTSTVSQCDTILTTQPSTQSIAANSSLSDQSSISVNRDPSTSNHAGAISNGTASYHPTRRFQPGATGSSSSSNTSESINADLSPSVNSPPVIQTPNNNQWRHKLNNLKQSFQSVGTPRFHRRPKILRNVFVVSTSLHLRILLV